MAKFSQSIDNETHDSGRNRETQPLAPSALRQNKRIDAEHISVNINQWTTTIAGIDGCVGLDEHHWQSWIRLAIHRAYHAHGDGVAESFRIPECEHELTLSDRAFRIKREIGQCCGINLEQSQVCIFMDAHEACHVA